MNTTNKRTLIIASAALVTGVVLGWALFGNSSNREEPDHNHDSLTAVETIWTCAMHPQIRKNEPGNCPICGMKLIPLESVGTIDPSAVSMTPAAMQLADVRTLVVGQGEGARAIRLTGKVQADERRMFTQSSHLGGRIETLTVNFTGEFVSRGQVIANVYSPELVTAQEELFEAKKISTSQPELFQAAKEKLKNWKLTEKQIDDLLATGKTLEQFPVLANVSGFVTQRMVNLGDYIKLGQPIFKIADLSKVWILFDVYEADMSWIKKGDKIVYTIQSLPGKSFTGTIRYLDPTIDPKTRVAKARIEVDNRGQILKPEMFASGTLESGSDVKSQSIAIPKSAVMWTGKRSVVYVKNMTEYGVTFKMREVTLGAASEKAYTIEAGLLPGEEIAVNGTFSIDAAAQLAGKPSMMSADSPDDAANKPSSSSMESEFEIDKVMRPLFDAYFSLKDALANDDLVTAKTDGNRFSSALDNIPMNIFQGSGHDLWMKQSAILKTHSTPIENLGSLEEVRSHFMSISTAMIKIGDAFNPVSKSVYVQHCPMADSNKGADWLSLEKEILNPYFGASMLRCGETIRTLD
jgi:Cu(I)/Ag(I) efflux system membrane fusion protein